MRSKGFTLIEVLIVVMIMAILGAMSAQSIRNSTLMKSKIQKGIDQVSALKSALTVIERDINLAFHYRDLNYELEKEHEKKKQEQAAASGQPYDEKPLQVPTQVTIFEGESDSLAFTSLANVHINPDTQESEQMEVQYQLKSCRSYIKPDTQMKCLFRQTSPTLDADFSTMGDETPILEGVTTFNLRYYGAGKQDWVTLWKTAEGADDVTRDRFPYAVEITLETEDNGKKIKLTTVAEVRLPNNKPLPKEGEIGGSSR